MNTPDKDEGLPPIIWMQDDTRAPLKVLSWVMWKASRERTDPTAKACYELLAAHLFDAQVFEFGRVPEDRFVEEAKRGGDLIEQGFLDLPYETCVFWSTFLPLKENGPMPAQVRFCSIAHRFEQAGRKRYLMLDAAAVPGEDGRLLTGDNTLRGTPHIVSGFGIVEPLGGGKWGGIEIESCSMLSGGPVVDRMAALADGLGGMCMLLATDGVPRTTVTPSPKLQAKRERNGHLPLPTVTFIDTQRWAQARANTAAKGHHQSPVPHLRRGHLRTYKDGHRVWIRDMLVNATSYKDIPPRDHYDAEDPT